MKLNSPDQVHDLLLALTFDNRIAALIQRLRIDLRLEHIDKLVRSNTVEGLRKVLRSLSSNPGSRLSQLSFEVRLGKTRMKTSNILKGVTFARMTDFSSFVTNHRDLSQFLQNHPFIRTLRVRTLMCEPQCPLSILQNRCLRRIEAMDGCVKAMAPGNPLEILVLERCKPKGVCKVAQAMSAQSLTSLEVRLTDYEDILIDIADSFPMLERLVLKESLTNTVSSSPPGQGSSSLTLSSSGNSCSTINLPDRMYVLQSRSSTVRD